jgi:GcrA cell cycle regulator
MWTDERVEILKKRWSEGVTCAQIAIELGGVTRNSVIGKVHRMGLPGRPKPVPVAGKEREAAPPKQFRRSDQPSSPRKESDCPPSLSQQSAAEVGAADAYVPREDLMIVPDEQKLTLLELRKGRCRWPLGKAMEPAHFFCGGRVAHGSVYCGGHSRLAYSSVAK